MKAEVGLHATAKTGAAKGGNAKVPIPKRPSTTPPRPRPGSRARKLDEARGGIKTRGSVNAGRSITSRGGSVYMTPLEAMSHKMDEADEYMRRIQQQKRDISRNERRIKEYKLKMLQIQEQISSYLSDKTMRDKAGGAAAVHRWENKLNTASIKHSKAKSTISTIKVQINNARLAQVEHKKQWKEINEDYVKAQAVIIEHEQRIKDAKAAKVAAEERTKQVKLAAEEEAVAFKKKLQELTGIIDSRTEDLARTKAAKKMSPESEGADSRRDSATIAALSGFMGSQMSKFNLGSLTMQQEEKISSSIQKNRWLLGATGISLANQQKRAQNYELAFKTLMEKTGLSSVKDIVDSFITREKDYFNLYKHAQNIERQMTELRESIAKVQMDLDKFTGTDEYASHEKQKLDDLKVQEAKIDQNIEQIKANNEEMERMLGSIKVAINKTHKDLEFGFLSTDTLSEKDGLAVKKIDSAPRGSTPILEISDTNMMQYLGIIEQQLTEITLAHSFVQRRDGNVVHSSANLDMDPRDLGMATVQSPRLPNVEDEGYSSDEGVDDDAELRPISRKEFWERTQNHYERKRRTRAEYRRGNLKSNKA